MKKNINRLSFFNIGVSSSFLDPILIIFFMIRGLSFAELMALTSIAYITVFSTEILSGYLADKCGDKRIILLGLALNIISVLFFIFAVDYIYYVLGSIFSGLSASMISGADESFAFRLLNEESIDFGTYISKIKSYSFYFMAIVNVIGAWAFKLDTNLPLYLNLALYVTILIIVTRINEDHLTKTLPLNQSNNAKVSLTSSLINILRKERKFIFAVFISVTVAIFTFIGKSLTQPILNQNSIDIVYFGVIYFSFNMIAGYGSKLYCDIRDKVRNYFIELIYLAILITFLLLGLLKGYSIFIPLMLLNLFRGIVGPYISQELNRTVNSEYRTTFLSINNFFVNLLVAISATISGFLVDKLGISEYLVLISIVIFGVALFAVIFKVRLSFSNQGKMGE